MRMVVRTSIVLADHEGFVPSSQFILAFWLAKSCAARLVQKHDIPSTSGRSIVLQESFLTGAVVGLSRYLLARGYGFGTLEITYRETQLYSRVRQHRTLSEDPIEL